MKFLLLSVVLCSVVCIFGQQYTQKYDNIDVDSVLSNSRIRTNYVKCLLETGPCTPEGRELRSEYKLNFKFKYLLNVLIILYTHSYGRKRIEWAKFAL